MPSSSAPGVDRGRKPTTGAKPDGRAPDRAAARTAARAARPALRAILRASAGARRAGGAGHPRGRLRGRRQPTDRDRRARLVHTLAGPAIEGATVVVRAGRIVAVGRRHRDPRRRARDRRPGTGGLPRLLRLDEHARSHRDPERRRDAGHRGARRLEPAPARARRGESGERAHPGRARERRHPCRRSAGRERLRHSRPRLRHSTRGLDQPGDGDRARDRRGRDLAGVDDSTLRSRHRALRRSTVRGGRRRSTTSAWANCAAGSASARRYASAAARRRIVAAGRRSAARRAGDVADGRLPLLVRADRERQIRDAVAFSAKESLRMVLVGGRESWRVADAARGEENPGHPRDRRRCCRSTRTSRTIGPYTLARDLRAAGVEVAISTLRRVVVVHAALRSGAGGRVRAGVGRRTGGDHPRVRP